MSTASYEFERVAPVHDGDAAGRDDSTESRWHVNGVDPKMSVCSDADTVEVVVAHCQG